MFKVGQKVICIKQHSQGILTVGAEYIIQDINKCVTCPMVALYVGIHHEKSKDGVWCNCGTTTDVGWGGPWFIYSGLFDLPKSNYAEETLKDIRILQLEEELTELKKLTKLEPLKQ